jgi:hypothetical protein
MHAVSNQNTYICEACETLLLEKEASSNREPEVPVESDFAHENWRKYLLRIIFFRALPSGLWITIFAKILNEVLPLTTDSGARELEADTMASSLVIFFITSFIFYIYYKATDEISVPGILITSVVCTVITVLEGILAFSVSRVNLLVSVGQESVSILNVFAHFPDYFNEPITGTIGLYIFWFPLLGLGLSTLMAVNKTKSVYSEIYP